jgi:hypothetical protein
MSASPNGYSITMAQRPGNTLRDVGDHIYKHCPRRPADSICYLVVKHWLTVQRGTTAPDSFNANAHTE